MAFTVPPADFFRRLGVFVAKPFSSDECRRLIAAIGEGRPSEGRVYGRAGEVVDLELKRNWSVEVAPSAVELVAARLLALLPQVETHFALSLSGCQAPDFKLYRAGGYHRPHTDDGAYLDAAPAEIGARRVTAVIFLNGEAREPAPGCYTGGALTLYRLIDDEPWRSRGFPLNGEAGLLVAFPPSVPHEVTTVESGERYSIASWYY